MERGFLKIECSPEYRAGHDNFRTGRCMQSPKEWPRESRFEGSGARCEKKKTGNPAGREGEESSDGRIAPTETVVMGSDYR